jgi:ribosomal protein S18 acetylase RimI-like enzyme
METRILTAGDEATLDRFLSRHSASSLILRSNLLVAGLIDRGQYLQGTYAARFEAGEITAVVAHYWNGRLILQAPAGGADLARLACQASRRGVTGLIGPWGQANEVRDRLGLAACPVALESLEDLFDLALTELRVPPSLAGGRVTCRRPRPDEIPLLVRWRVEFYAETTDPDRSPAVVAACGESIRGAHARGDLFLLEADGTPLASAAFNAHLPDCVQVGGVWTPPELRSRGHARAVVAGALLSARKQGATTGVLFTGQNNHPARKAYEALGFRRIGDYGIITFRDFQRVR